MGVGVPTDAVADRDIGDHPFGQGRRPTPPHIPFLGNQLRCRDTIVGMNTSLTYLLYLVWFVLWIVAIVDCAKSNNPNKVVWIVVIILLPFLGSILYFLIGRRNTWA